jgi:hypothetical protein
MYAVAAFRRAVYAEILAVAAFRSAVSTGENTEYLWNTSSTATSQPVLCCVPVPLRLKRQT